MANATLRKQWLSKKLTDSLETTGRLIIIIMTRLTKKKKGERNRRFKLLFWQLCLARINVFYTFSNTEQRLRGCKGHHKNL